MVWKIFLVIIAIVIIAVPIEMILLDIFTVKPKKKEKQIIPYIEEDDTEKISKEIDDFIRENNLYIPKE